MSSKAVEAVSAPVFRAACARFATGITVVTTVDEHKRPHGLTVNSFTSVSLTPPLVLVCVNRRNALLGHFLSASAYAINVLADHQENVSRRFSSSAEDRFEGVDWRTGNLGVPVLGGVLATFECAVTQVLELGDHTVLIGEVREATYADGNPLLYFNSGYRALNG